MRSPFITALRLKMPISLWARARSLTSPRATICVIKHGKEGSTAYTNDGKFYNIKPFPANLLKGFGGGDGYGSAFLYSLLQGKDIIDCLEFGSASASILVSAHSCSDAMPSALQVETFIRESKEKYGEMVARA